MPQPALDLRKASDRPHRQRGSPCKSGNGFFPIESQQPKKPRKGFYSCADQKRPAAGQKGRYKPRKTTAGQQAIQHHEKPTAGKYEAIRTQGRNHPRQDAKSRRNGRKASQAGKDTKSPKQEAHHRQRASVDKKTLNAARPPAIMEAGRKRITCRRMKPKAGTATPGNRNHGSRTECRQAKPEKPKKGTETAKPCRLPQAARKARKRAKSKPQGHTGTANRHRQRSKAGKAGSGEAEKTTRKS